MLLVPGFDLTRIQCRPRNLSTADKIGPVRMAYLKGRCKSLLNKVPEKLLVRIRVAETYYTLRN